MGDRHTGHRDEFGPERLNALTDGVFAIILTLLVLELKLPDLDEGDEVLAVLGENIHVFVAWLVSFVAIARFWMVHHTIAATLRGCHTVTIALTFALLCAASLMPFTADTLGNARIAEPWSTVLFAANFALVSLALGLLAHHAATEPRLAHPGGPHQALERHRHRHLVVLPLVSLAAAVLAFAHPYVSIALLMGEFAAAAWVGLRRRGPHEEPAGSMPGLAEGGIRTAAGVGDVPDEASPARA